MDLLGQSFVLAEGDAGEFSALKVRGINFRIRCFYAEGLGHAGSMTASGMLRLMKIDTLIINSFEKHASFLLCQNPRHAKRHALP